MSDPLPQFLGYALLPFHNTIPHILNIMIDLTCAPEGPYLGKFLSGVMSETCGVEHSSYSFVDDSASLS